MSSCAKKSTGNDSSDDDRRLVGQPPFSAKYIDPPRNQSKKYEFIFELYLYLFLKFFQR